MLIQPIMPRLPALTVAGALPATVELSGERHQDETSFITALGLRALRARPDGSGQAVLRARMVGFLERCQVSDPPGAFAFWPTVGRPAWAAIWPTAGRPARRMRVPADADDTALCIAELYLAGRLGRSESVRRVSRLLLPNRVRHDGTLRPDWIPAGAFATWLVPEKGGRNIVDCVVNANILALISLLGMRDPPGRRQAVRLILDGLDWAGTDADRLGALTPFYPEPGEFRLAVEHAVACGCVELAPAAVHLRRLTGSAVPGPEDTLCAAAYNRIGWRSPALAALRSMPTAARDLSSEKRQP